MQQTLLMKACLTRMRRMTILNLMRCPHYSLRAFACMQEHHSSQASSSAPRSGRFSGEHIVLSCMYIFLLMLALVLQATPKSDATAVDHLGASIANADKGKGEQSQSETSSGSIKQEQQANTADQAHVAAVPLKPAAADATASAPTITAAEAAKTRHTRACKPAVAQAIADAEPEPPARRRTSILKERQRERAQSEQTDEDFVLSSSRGKPKGKAAGSKAGKGKQAAAAAASDRTKTAKASLPPVMEDSPEPPEEMDILLGCTKCRYLKGGCGACRDKPSMERPTSLRWKPDASRQQKVCLLRQKGPCCPGLH